MACKSNNNSSVLEKASLGCYVGVVCIKILSSLFFLCCPDFVLNLVCISSVPLLFMLIKFILNKGILLTKRLELDM